MEMRAVCLVSGAVRFGFIYLFCWGEKMVARWGLEFLGSNDS